MSQEKKTLTGSIALTRLVHVKMKKKNKKGELIECLVIPIKENALHENEYENRDGKKVTEVSIPVRVLYDPVTNPKTKQNGFIAKSLPSDVYKEKKEDEEFLKVQQPILGNIKDWSLSAPAPVSNDVGEKDSYDEDDDLPF